MRQDSVGAMQHQIGHDIQLHNTTILSTTLRYVDRIIKEVI
jgi:hypothetical protein